MKILLTLPLLFAPISSWANVNFMNQCVEVWEGQKTSDPAYSTFKGLFDAIPTPTKTCQSIEQPLKNIKELSLSDLGLTDLSPLSGITSLESLDISQNNIADQKLIEISCPYTLFWS